MRQILDQLETVASSTRVNREGVVDGNGDQLSAEQAEQVERGLRELKALSKLCKQQHSEEDDGSSIVTEEGDSVEEPLQGEDPLEEKDPLQGEDPLEEEERPIRRRPRKEE